MKLYLNCTKNINEAAWNKADYLIAAAQRSNLDVVLYRGEPNPECVLNIEPFTDFVTGSKWTGIWEIDLLCDRPELSGSNWISSDTVFLAISSLPSHMEHFRDRTTLLFQACDPLIHKRSNNAPQYDFVFTGSMGHPWYEERERIFRILKDYFSCENFGKGFAPQQYVEKLSQGKVQVIRSMRTPVADGELAQRFFESLAIGPVLTNQVDDLKHTGLVEGEDYFAYATDGELLGKMSILLQNPDRAKVMAENGRKKALLYHTYDSRLMTIFQHIYEKVGESK